MNAVKLSRYKKIDLSDASPGMVLSDPLLNSQGEILVSSGTTLTDSLLNALSRRGIELVSVIDDSITEADLQAERQRVQHRSEHLFRRAAQGSATLQLKSLILRYRLGMLK